MVHVALQPGCESRGGHRRETRAVCEAGRPLEDLGHWCHALEASLRLERDALGDYLEERHAAILRDIGSQFGCCAPHSLLGLCGAAEQGYKAEQVRAAVPPDELVGDHIAGLSVDVAAALSTTCRVLDAEQVRSAMPPRELVDECSSDFSRDQGLSSLPGLSRQCRVLAAEPVHSAMPSDEVQQREPKAELPLGSGFAPAGHEAASGQQSSQNAEPLSRCQTTAGSDVKPVEEPVDEPRLGCTSWRHSHLELEGFTPLQKFSVSATWDIVSAVLIVLNIVAMGAEMQYEGLQNAFEVNYHGFSDPAKVVMPGWDDAFSVGEWVLGIALSLEVLAKLFILREKFFTTLKLLPWNLLDLVVVSVWVIFRSLTLDGGSPMLLRCLRLARLARLVRVIHWIRIFDSLYLILRSIESSISILIWSLVLLLFIMMVLAMFIGNSLTAFMRDPEVDQDVRQMVFEKWGTFLRAVTTMFAITLANWAPTCWELMNNVDVLWGLFFVTYKCTVGFAVVQVITSVFIQQTFKIAARDEEIMIREKMTSSQSLMKQMAHLFQVLDESGDGIVTREEWDHMLTTPKIRSWFAALEVDVTTANELFDILDDGDGKIAQEEFMESLKRIKGFAKSTDMIALATDTRRLKQLMEAIRVDLTQLDGRLGDAAESRRPAALRQAPATGQGWFCLR